MDYFGGYPGAVTLTEDRERWARYIHDSPVETTVSRDILLNELSAGHLHYLTEKSLLPIPAISL